MDNATGKGTLSLPKRVRPLFRFIERDVGKTLFLSKRMVLRSAYVLLYECLVRSLDKKFTGYCSFISLINFDAMFIIIFFLSSKKEHHCYDIDIVYRISVPLSSTLCYNPERKLLVHSTTPQI